MLCSRNLWVNIVKDNRRCSYEGKEFSFIFLCFYIRCVLCSCCTGSIRTRYDGDPCKQDIQLFLGKSGKPLSRTHIRRQSCKVERLFRGRTVSAMSASRFCSRGGATRVSYTTRRGLVWHGQTRGQRLIRFLLRWCYEKAGSLGRGRLFRF